MKNIKSKVIQDIIDVLDNAEGEKLKMHPKLMAAKVTIAKPLDKKEEPMPECEDMGDEEMPMDDIVGDISELDPEMKKKLMKALM